jgi:hypothetical protein
VTARTAYAEHVPTDHEMPADPVPPTQGAWIAIYEMYRRARSGGFNFIEAAVMVAAMAAIRKPDEPS